MFGPRNTDNGEINQRTSVLWSDWSKFEISGSTFHVFVRRRKGEKLVSTCWFHLEALRRCDGEGVLSHARNQHESHSRTMTLNPPPGCVRGVMEAWRSPDLNPIEMVWEEMDCREKAKGLKRAQHLLQDSWKTISGDHLMKLIQRWPTVSKAVILF